MCILKTSLLNGWATKAFDPPETPNNIYPIAGAWVKPIEKNKGGTTATFVSIEEEARINKKCNNKLKRKKKREQQQQQLMQLEVQPRKANRSRK